MTMAPCSFLTLLRHAAGRSLALLSAFLTLFLLSAPARAEVIESVGAPGMCIDYARPDRQGVRYLELMPCTGIIHQQWSIPRKTNLNPMPIGPIAQVGACIEVSERGASARMRECYNHDSQRWLFAQNGRVLNGAKLCLDAEGGGRTAGTRIIGYSCTDGDNQKWRIRNMREGDATGPVPVREYRQTILRPRHAESKCLDVSPDGWLILWSCHGQKNQRFDFNVGPLTTIKVNGWCLGPSSGPGQPLKTRYCSSDPLIQWRTTEQGGFQNSVSKRCIDVERGASANGTRLIEYACNGQVNQRFKATQN